MNRSEYLLMYPHEAERDMTVQPQHTVEIPKVDVTELAKRNVNLEIFQRGTKLFNKGLAHQNSTYPWRYLVAGDPHDTGTSAYSVDLSKLTCSCPWREITGGICKHLVASLLDYLGKNPVD